MKMKNCWSKSIRILDFDLKKYQIVRRIINDLITDFRKNHATEPIEQYDIRSVSDVRSCQKRIAGFSKEVAEKNKELKKFLHKNMYQSSTGEAYGVQSRVVSDQIV